MKEQSLNRADFIKLAKCATLTFAGTAIGLHKVDFSEHERMIYPMPTWLNPDNEPIPKFFNTNEGHVTYMKALARKSEVLHRTLTRVLEERYFDPPQHPPLLGNCFRKHVSIAEEELEKELGKKPDLSDTLRAASLTLAVGAILTPAEVSQHIDLRHSENSDQIINLQRQVMIATYPRVFPVLAGPEIPLEDRVFRFIGVDRFQHFAQHLAIVSELKHLHNFGVENFDLMPTPIAEYLKYYNPFGVAELNFSELAGRGWEAKEGLKKPPWKVYLFDSNSGVQTGPWDSFMTLDFAANRVGSFVGRAITEYGKKTNLDGVINVMNSPQITNPIQEEIYPEVNLDFAKVLL
jgi:hypothetical protein